ncbi:MAG: DUF1579 family protein [Vitreoscilla sp.]
MPFVARSVAFLLLGAVQACLAADPATTPASAPTPATTYGPLAMEAGTWKVQVEFFDADSGASTGHAQGRQVNTLLANGHWIVNDLRVFGADGKTVDFQGHGAWGWDPVGKEYVDTWVDTNDGAPRIDHGFWVAEQQTMYWSAQQPDGEGHAVTYRMTETFAGPRRTLVFFQIALQSGRQIKLAEMKFTRED